MHGGHQARENVTLQSPEQGWVRARGLNMESEEPALHFHECDPWQVFMPPGNQFLSLVFYYEEFNI